MEIYSPASPKGIFDWLTLDSGAVFPLAQQNAAFTLTNGMAQEKWRPDAHDSTPMAVTEICAGVKVNELVSLDLHEQNARYVTWDDES